MSFETLQISQRYLLKKILVQSPNFSAVSSTKRLSGAVISTCPPLFPSMPTVRFRPDQKRYLPLGRRSTSNCVAQMRGERGGESSKERRNQGAMGSQAGSDWLWLVCRFGSVCSAAPPVHAAQSGCHYAATCVCAGSRNQQDRAHRLPLRQHVARPLSLPLSRGG